MHSFTQGHQQVDGDRVVDLCGMFGVCFHDGFTRVHFHALLLEHVNEREKVALLDKEISWKVV